jgi:hypothetical protein
MPKAEKLERERSITRATSRLFWEANLQARWALFFGYIFRISAWICNIVLVPLFVSYGLEAILTKRFDLVFGYAMTVLILVSLFSLFISIGEWLIIKNALTGSDIIQKRIFSNYLSKDYEFYADAFYGSLAAQASQMRESYNLWGKLVTLDIPRLGVIIGVSMVVIGI